MTLDQDSWIEFRDRFVTDLGATMAAGNVVVGHRLGLYRALATGARVPGAAGRAIGNRPPVCRRVVGRSGRWRVRHLRRVDRQLLNDGRTGVRHGRP